MPNSSPSPETRFKRGQSGNPKGRPKGSRDKITERALALISDVLTEGDAVNSTAGLMKLRDQDPATFWRLIVGLFPKDVHVKGDYTDAHISEALSATDEWVERIIERQKKGEDEEPEPVRH